ncbi:MAG TPA: Clp protease N-terminal domain-containing protein [Solirubrobacteraceae bacterium]|nr:Clp protease N-terminal domain-containing protein [Solirubrobacteraceae bacterium]
MEFNVDGLAALAEERAASPAALDRLRAAVVVVEDVRAQGDELLDRFVAAARQERCSWSEIGEVLGVSKQAAHQRFLPVEQAPGTWPAHATDLVRQAVATGEREARAMGHNYLGTEHVLLGLLAQHDGIAAQALEALGVNRAGVVARIGVVIGTGPERTWTAACVAPRLKRALEIARSYARSLGMRCMDTEHVLLALGDVEDSVAAQILRDLEAPPTAVREQLAGMLGIEPERLVARKQRRRLLRPVGKS